MGRLEWLRFALGMSIAITLSWPSDGGGGAISLIFVLNKLP